MKSKLLIAVSLLSLGLVSCGGGGGSSSTPTPIVTTPSPTPTPSTTASPVVVVNTAESSAEEGQVLTLDGSQTSDSDSNASDLSFSWTQLTGSPATIVSPAEAVTEIFAAEVTADEVATFQLSVSDGENTASETIDLTFTNVFQSPRASVSFSTSQLTQSVPTASEIIIDTIGDSEFNSIFVKPQGSDLLKIASSYEPGDTAIADEVDNVALALTRAEVTSARDTTGRTVLYAASVFLDRVDAFTLDTFSSEFNESSGGYFISSPCDITDITGGAFQVSVRGVDNFSNINIVGQTNGGFEIVGTNFENSSNGNSARVTGATTLQSLGTDESYCLMQFSDALSIPTDIAENSSLGGVITALDFDSQTVDLFVDSTERPDGSFEFTVGQSPNPQYELTSSFPVLPAGEPSLEIISAERVEVARGETAMLVLLSDGNHIGEHRAVLLSLVAAEDNGSTGSNDLAFTRTVMSWDRGVPENAFVAIDGGFFNKPTVIINTSTSPEAVVFESDASTVTGEFTGPSFFELGLDVNTIAPAIFDQGRSSAIVTFSSDENQLELRSD